MVGEWGAWWFVLFSGLVGWRAGAASDAGTANPGAPCKYSGFNHLPTPARRTRQEVPPSTAIPLCTYLPFNRTHPNKVCWCQVGRDTMRTSCLVTRPSAITRIPTTLVASLVLFLPFGHLVHFVLGPLGTAPLHDFGTPLSELVERTCGEYTTLWRKGRER